MKLFISNDLGYDFDKSRLLSEFVLFCAEHLPIEEDFKVFVVNNRKPHNITTTAVYECGNNTCKIYGKNRALVDVMRSIAHEMTHMMQDEMGLLVGHIQDAGGFHEDQANSKAGELIKLFAKSKEDRKAIYENKRIQSTKNLFDLMYDPASGLNEEKSSLGRVDLNTPSAAFSTDPGGPSDGPNPFKDDPKIGPNIGKGVNMTKVDPKINQIVKSVFQIYEKDYKKKYGDKVPFVTSLYRGPAVQAKVMFNNWKMHGGKEDGKGNKYLLGLYKDKKMAKAVGDVFTKTGKHDGAIPILKKQAISGHAGGKAVDFRSKDRPYMKELLEKVKKSFPSMKINDETKNRDGSVSPNQHWHVGVS